MFSRNFYESESQVQVQRTSTPTGMINNPLELATHTRPWLMINTGHLEEKSRKRTLIFADHYYKDRSDNEKSQIEDKLSKARWEGFTIYTLSAEGRLNKLEERQLDSGYSLNPKIYTREAIRKLAYDQLKISANHLYLLDYFGINDLVESETNTLSLDFIKNKNTLEANEFFSIAQLKSYVIEIKSKEDMIRVEELAKMFKWDKETIKLHIDAKSFNESELRDIIKSTAQVVGIENVDEKNEGIILDAIKNKQLENLRNFEMGSYSYQNIIPKCVAEILTNASQLEKLSIRSSAISSQLENLKKGHFKNIKEACFYKADVSATSFEKFWLAAPGLKKIKILDMDTNKAFINLKEGQLLNLNSVNLCDSAISMEALDRLFMAAPELEELLIHYSKHKIKDSLTKLKNDQVKKLKRVYLANASAASLQRLIEVAPKIEILHLSGCENINHVFENLKKGQLENLKIFDTECHELSALSLKKLLANTPLIEILFNPHSFSLKKNDLSGSFSDLKKSQLKNLKEIYLRKIILSKKDLQNLLVAAPHLEKIDLFESKNIEGGLEILNSLQLTNLSTINLRETTLTKNDVLGLLCAASKLEELYLSKCKGIAGAFKALKPGQLKNLKKLNLYKTNVTKEDVQALLAAAPEIEELDLSGCNISGGLASLQKGQLKNLKRIFLDDTDLVKEDLQSLLAAAPLIEKVYLSSCKNIGGGFKSLKNGQLENIKELNLTDSGINQEDITSLSSVAPKMVEAFLKDQAESDKRRDFYAQLSKTNVSKSKDTANAVVEEDKKGSPKTNVVVEEGEISDPKTFFDTKDANPKLNFVEYFPSVSPSHYRLKNFEPDLKKLIYKDIKPGDFKRIEHDRGSNYLSLYRCHKGNTTISISENDGGSIILPSLDAEEKLFDLKVIDDKGHSIDLSKVILERSATAGYYKITLPEKGKFSIYYQVAINDSKPKLPSEIDKLVEKYNSYEISKLSPNTVFKNFSEAAKYIRSKKIGRCQLRAIAAYDELKEKYPDKVRIVENDVHSYLELHMNGCWYKLELGGYRAQLEKIPLKLTEPLQEEKQPLNVSLTSPSPEFKSEVVPADKASMSNLLPSTALPVESKDEIEKKEIPPILVHADSDTALKTYYASLAKEYKPDNIFIAHRPEDLSLTGAGLTQDGVIKKPYTRFGNWLSERSEGIICIDIRDFNASEVAQLNDLLDRKIEGKPISKNLQIVILDHLERDQYGPDFRRRVPSEIYLPSEKAEDLLPEMEFKSIDNVHGESIEIDLFNSYYWQASLIGLWQLNQKAGETALSFQWKKGGLVEKALDSTSTRHIIIKNPPLHDPSFRTFMAEIQSLQRVEWADQVTLLPNTMQFSQTNGYAWEALSKQATLHAITKETRPYILSDATILSFVQDPRYEFSKRTDQLEPQLSYLSLSEKNKTSIEVLCAPGLSKGALAQFLTAAKNKNVSVKFFTPVTQAIPSQSPLNELNFSKDSINSIDRENKEEKVTEILTLPNVEWQLHQDIYFAVRELLKNNKDATCFDMSCLEATELGRFPILPESMRAKILETGKLEIAAPLSAILQKLIRGETVILSGKIPPSIYPALAGLTLGLIENEPFKGKLIILATQEDESVVKALTGRSLKLEKPTMQSKIKLLTDLTDLTEEKRGYNESQFKFIIELSRQPEETSYASLERQLLQQRLAKAHTPLPLSKGLFENDEDLAKKVDKNRLQEVEAALALSPWAMLGGPTGIGKTYFLQNVLAKEETVMSVEEWLNKLPPKGKRAILVVDEASFLSQLNGEGENFLERFKGLQAKPPGFLWRGKYYQLSPEHKVIFAFNPASYGAGRSTSGFLNEQALAVSFQTLPYYYVRARLILPLLQKMLANSGLSDEHLNIIASPLVSVYSWIIENSPPETVIITPREIKAMVSLIASKILKDNISDKAILTNLATEVSYNLSKQTLQDHPGMIEKFSSVKFKSLQEVCTKRKMPDGYLEYQHPAYCQLMDLLEARATVLNKGNTDLGLGGILLEGGSGIGKSHFVQRVVDDYEKKTGEKVYRISPTTPFHEKVRWLNEAAEKGAVVLMEEMNTSLLPSMLLNNFMMGLDKDGQPCKKPGFMLIGTQNPPSFPGRSDEDPALRQRLLKLNLKWPVYRSPGLQGKEDQYLLEKEDKDLQEEKKAVKGFQELLKEAVDVFKQQLDEYLIKNPDKKKAKKLQENWSNLTAKGSWDELITAVHLTLERERTKGSRHSLFDKVPDSELLEILKKFEQNIHRLRDTNYNDPRNLDHTNRTWFKPG